MSDAGFATGFFKTTCHSQSHLFLHISPLMLAQFISFSPVSTTTYSGTLLFSRKPPTPAILSFIKSCLHVSCTHKPHPHTLLFSAFTFPIPHSLLPFSFPPPPFFFFLFSSFILSSRGSLLSILLISVPSYFVYKRLSPLDTPFTS